MSDLGELLRQARVYKGASLRDAERATRISRTYLEALENQDFSQLPPPAYARGIVKNYAQYLGLDPAAILSLYDSSDEESVGETVQVVPATRPMDVRSHWAPNFAIIGFMLVVSAIVFAWLYSAYFQPENIDPDVASGFPTVTPMGESLLGTVVMTPTPQPATNEQDHQQSDEPTPLPDAAAPEPTNEPVIVIPTQAPVVVEEVPTAVPEVPEVSEGIVEWIVNDGGSNEFVITATEEVWLEISLDWSGIPDFDGTLFAGQSIYMLADVATVRSGNAGFLQVFVNGEPYGILSETWNATVTLP